MSIRIARRMRSGLTVALVCLQLPLFTGSGARAAGLQTVEYHNPCSSPPARRSTAASRSNGWQPGNSRRDTPEPATDAATPEEELAAATRAAVALFDPDAYVREDAVRQLSGRRGETELPLLQQALTDIDPRVRSAAIDSLADLGGDDAAAALAVVVMDAEVALREQAVYALARVGGPAALGALRQALGDQEEAVREAASDVLAELDSQRPLRPGRPAAASVLSSPGMVTPWGPERSGHAGPSHSRGRTDPDPCNVYNP